MKGLNLGVMTTAQVVETSVTVNNNNSPIQDYVFPDDQLNLLLYYKYHLIIQYKSFIS